MSHGGKEGTLDSLLLELMQIDHGRKKRESEKMERELWRSLATLKKLSFTTKFVGQVSFLSLRSKENEPSYTQK